MLAILLHIYPFTNIAIFPLLLVYCFCFARSNDEKVIVVAAWGAIGCAKYKGRKEKVLPHDIGKDGDDEIEKDVYANYIERYHDIEPHIVKMAYDVHMGVDKNMEIALMSPDPSLLIIQVSASCIFDLHLLFFSIVWRQLNWFANKVVYKFLIGIATRVLEALPSESEAVAR